MQTGTDVPTYIMGIDARVLVVVLGFGGPILGGIVGGVVAQVLGHRRTLERERKAELRKALAEFAASGFSALTMNTRMLITSGHAKLLGADRNTHPEVLKAANKMADDAGADYFRELDRFVEGRCRVLLLENDPSRQAETDGLYERVLVTQSKESAGKDRGMLNFVGIEVPNLRREMEEWIQAQSKRTDV
jgi:hypothetical protein